MRRPPPWSDFGKYPITGGTIVLAVLVTLGWWSGRMDMTPLFENEGILRWQLWRVLTSTLPHANILHLAFNAYWIWIFGALIEQTFGHARTLGIFVLFAVCANGAEYALLDGGVGLSGVGYGLFGLLWVLSVRDRRFAGAVDQRTVLLFVAWFFFCILITYLGYPIANVAHGVGAVAGALLGWTISSSWRRRIAGSAGVAILAAACILGGVLFRPWINCSPRGGDDEGRLGYEALIANRNEEALRWLRDATRMEPRNAGFWNNLGIAYSRLNRHEEAVAASKRAAALDPVNYGSGGAARRGD